MKSAAFIVYQNDKSNRFIEFYEGNFSKAIINIPLDSKEAIHEFLINDTMIGVTTRILQQSRPQIVRRGFFRWGSLQ